VPENEQLTENTVQEVCQVRCQVEKKYFFNRKKSLAFLRGCGIL
jgi:hypothetical protein